MSLSVCLEFSGWLLWGLGREPTPIEMSNPLCLASCGDPECYCTYCAVFDNAVTLRGQGLRLPFTLPPRMWFHRGTPVTAWSHIILPVITSDLFLPETMASAQRCSWPSIEITEIITNDCDDADGTNHYEHYDSTFSLSPYPSPARQVLLHHHLKEEGMKAFELNKFPQFAC